MKEKTKFVAFSTQKGGAGKTTLTVLAASYLHYVKGFNVAVIDCDYPQHSIVEMRERDLKLALEDEHYKRLAYEQFTRLQKKAILSWKATRKRRWPMPTTSCRKVISIMCSSTFPVRSITRI